MDFGELKPSLLVALAASIGFRFILRRTICLDFLMTLWTLRTFVAIPAFFAIAFADNPEFEATRRMCRLSLGVRADGLPVDFPVP